MEVKREAGSVNTHTPSYTVSILVLMEVKREAVGDCYGFYFDRFQSLF